VEKRRAAREAARPDTRESTGNPQKKLDQGFQTKLIDNQGVSHLNRKRMRHLAQ
jgi:hypothetical protein